MGNLKYNGWLITKVGTALHLEHNGRFIAYLCKSTLGRILFELEVGAYKGSIHIAIPGVAFRWWWWPR